MRERNRDRQAELVISVQHTATWYCQLKARTDRETDRDRVRETERDRQTDRERERQ